MASARISANALRAAASRSPVEFFDALRQEGVPVGLHLRHDKWQEMQFHWSGADGGADQTTVGHAAQVFQSSHPG